MWRQTKVVHGIARKLRMKVQPQVGVKASVVEQLMLVEVHPQVGAKASGVEKLTLEGSRILGAARAIGTQTIALVAMKSKMTPLVTREEVEIGGEVEEEGGSKTEVGLGVEEALTKVTSEAEVVLTVVVLEVEVDLIGEALVVEVGQTGEALVVEVGLTEEILVGEVDQIGEVFVAEDVEEGMIGTEIILVKISPTAGTTCQTRRWTGKVIVVEAIGMIELMIKPSGRVGDQVGRLLVEEIALKPVDGTEEAIPVV